MNIIGFLSNILEPKKEYMLARLESFFKDKNGRVVLWQPPNALLYGWIISRALLLPFSDGAMGSALRYVSTALLIVWACLELTKGVNYFRRLLGMVVLAAAFANLL